MNGPQRPDRDRDVEQDYENASRVSSAEDASGPLDGDDTPPGRGDTGSTHPEADPTGNIGISDHSVAEDLDRG